MRKRQKLHICLILLCGCCLAGCQAAPEEVKEAAENYNENVQMDEIAITKCDLEGVKNSVDEALQLRPNNMTLPSSVDFSEVEEINELKLVYQSDFLNKREQVASIFGITDSNWENVELPLENDRTMTLGDDTYVLNVSDNGFFCAVLPDFYKKLEEDTTVLQTLYRIDEGDSAEDICVLNGTQTTISEQVSYVENWIDELELLGDDFDYRIKTVALRQDETGNNALTMDISKSYRGVMLDTCGGKIEVEDNVGTLKTIGSSFMVALLQKNKIDYFTTADGLLSINEKNTLNELIDLPSAIRIVEKELSGFQTIHISDIEIMYELEPVYDSTEKNANNAEPGGKVVARPIYRFLIDREYEDGGIGFIAGDTLNYFINVDMVTGEVDLNLDMSVYKQGDE